MVKVIAITGSGRSGSTILDNILGGVDGAFSAGELRYLWQRGLIEGRLCGCSQPLPECEVWPRVVAAAYPEGIDAAATAQLLQLVRTRYTLAMTSKLLRGWYRNRLAPLVEILDGLYPAIAAETGARFIVDSSKLPAYTFALSLVPSVDLRIVHLVRDPRAVAYSRGRSKEQLDTAEKRSMTRSGPLRSAADWLVWNLAIRRVFGADRSPYLLLRYEDMIADPEAALAQILELAGETGAGAPHLRGSSVDLTANHTVSGNPARFQTGSIDLKLDEAWRRRLPVRDRRIVEAVTAPARGSFGYGK